MNLRTAGVVTTTVVMAVEDRALMDTTPTEMAVAEAVDVVGFGTTLGAGRERSVYDQRHESLTYHWRLSPAGLVWCL